jgi:diacylglycerol kinase (ATP)
MIRDLLASLFKFEFVFSEFAGHTVDLSRKAREDGFHRLICVGGDGTLNEAVNGLMSAAAGGAIPQIGIVPSGTGSDLARSLKIPSRVEEACLRLACPKKAVSDLGMVSYTGNTGPESRYFVNAAGLGYDTEVVLRRNGFNRYVRGTIPYVASIATTLMGYRNKDVQLTIDGVQESRRINMVVVAIGRFFGGGMQIAPDAAIGDGFFDVITIGDVNAFELVCNFPKVYKGTHLHHPKVKVERTRTVSVESVQPVRIQADGDPLGSVPARFQIIPRALTFLC